MRLRMLWMILYNARTLPRYLLVVLGAWKVNTISDMINFSVREFNELWLSEGGAWESNARLFRLAATTFTNVATNFIKKLPPKLYVDQVEERCDQVP
ncbi:hypothetical protein PPTG_23068 [Phytophthora nicotianae INRA-310]|uniref:Uncharacterized protein n=1 Tax=Phytophthora nicotianae (strain INRA-310) TaxID=761204 RepID=W2Q4M3_PHYN3|nr:hypothetical protein PPTG_23068 [Phytophthora nicotianae INRA-310]ETN08148.1 hypothetical protein PPTG_23068 [Phytophthora nicotianae INRA-310]